MITNRSLLLLTLVAALIATLSTSWNANASQRLGLMRMGRRAQRLGLMRIRRRDPELDDESEHSSSHASDSHDEHQPPMLLLRVVKPDSHSHGAH